MVARPALCTALREEGPSVEVIRGCVRCVFVCVCGVHVWCKGRALSTSGPVFSPRFLRQTSYKSTYIHSLDTRHVPCICIVVTRGARTVHNCARAYFRFLFSYMI